VAVVAAMKAAAENDIEAAFALDARLDAFKPAAELREASRQMGYQTLRVAAATTGSAPLLALWAAVEAGRTPGHHAVAFGFACQACGASPTDAAAAYLHSTAALVVGAGVRLLGLGQLQGQRVLAALRPLLARLAAEAAGSSADAMWSFVPGVEIAGMRHASLEARLFRS
jgi:urease accessory protein